IADFDLLIALIAHLGPRLLTTPHLLSQVSDLTDLKGPELFQARALLKRLIENADEHFDAAKGLVAHTMFQRLGLADAGIAATQSTGVLILTVDLDLYLALQERGIESLNFHHLRRL